jgi:predicted RNA polymerase sigma factor
VASGGTSLQRNDLSSEAIRLMRQVRELTPENAETAGLLALMLLTDARRAARTGPNGELIPLDEQDRTLWDRAAIAEGTALASLALEAGLDGHYQIQAAIAALHDEAPSTAETDWIEIVALYSALKAIDDNPMVALNHAIATAMAHGPAVGLALLAPLQADPRLAGNHRLDAARAHLLERAGEVAAAEELYRSAASKATTSPERNYLLMRAAGLREVQHGQ